MAIEIKLLSSGYDKLAKDKVLFISDPSRIPPLNAQVGYPKNSDKIKHPKDLIEIGKIIDIIGSVKNPWVVVKSKKDVNVKEIPTTSEYYYFIEKTDKFKKGKKGKSSNFKKRDQKKNKKW